MKCPLSGRGRSVHAREHGERSGGAAVEQGRKAKDAILWAMAKKKSYPRAVTQS